MMAVMVSVFFVGGISIAQAVDISAPSFIPVPTLGVAPASYGAVMASTGLMPFSINGGTAGTVTGMVQEKVYNNTSLTGGLLFEYQIMTTASTGTNAIGAMSAYLYSSALVNADYDPSKNPTLGHFPARVNNAFGTVYTSFSTTLDAGEQATLYIQSNDAYYTTGGFSLLGAGTQSFSGFAPTATPEPATVALLGTGLLGLLGFRRKRMV
ncbi:MAG: PEP-CTERM sorting domain-containing protein [Candidatus Omnitrophica bacterium]|nr:PEP-CTERM sorting domain-containing protein [Candidatus Omnitrophota bacterium]